MFCPKCGGEYREGFTECSDCHVALTADPPVLEPAEGPEYVELVEVLRTFNPGDIAVIKAIMEDEGVRYVFEGESFNMLDPLIRPARLMVAKADVETAKESLKDMKLSYMAFPNLSPKDKSAEEEEPDGESDEPEVEPE